METSVPEQQPDLFDDQIDFEYATQGQRLLNLVIDHILMRLVVTYITADIAIAFVASFFPDWMDKMVNGDEMNFHILLFGLIVTYLHYLLYYIFCEWAFKGVTLGKLITGTKAIRLDGGDLTVKDAALRSVSRMVPFEVFSALGGNPVIPWHDRWTDTRVIKTR